MTIFDNSNMYMKRLIVFFPALVMYACNNSNVKSGAITADEKNYAATSVISADSTTPAFPLYTERLAAIKAALAKPQPVLLLNKADSNQQKAQLLALADTRFTDNLFDKKLKQPFCNEIFNIYNARPQEVPKGYNAATVYRVEMYNYALNLTTVALADIARQQVINVNTFPQTQPDLNPALTELATQIAVNAPDVIKALGYKPGEKEALMAATAPNASGACTFVWRLLL
jgi:hypothetical protein